MTQSDKSVVEEEVMKQDKGASSRGEDRATAASQSNPSVSSKAGIPSAGDTFSIVYPFVRGTYIDFNASSETSGAVDKPSWTPGVEYRDVSPEDIAPYADGEGRCHFTVVAAFKPGRYPMRVFYTRKYTDPDGKEFGKSLLHIATLAKFRRLVVGYRDAYGMDDDAPPPELWSGHHLRQSRAMFEELLDELSAQGIEARQGGDANAAPSQRDESPVAEGHAPDPSPEGSPHAN